MCGERTVGHSETLNTMLSCSYQGTPRCKKDAREHGRRIRNPEMPSNVEDRVLREVRDEEQGLGLEEVGMDTKDSLPDQARASLDKSDDAGSSKVWWGVPVPAAASRGVRALRLLGSSDKEGKEAGLPVLVSETGRDTSGSEEASQGSVEGKERVLVWNVGRLQVNKPGRGKGCKTLLSNIGTHQYVYKYIVYFPRIPISGGEGKVGRGC